MTELEIKQALVRTWVPFFSRFGRLTEVQVRTIPRILAGQNVVVISPSASGKTEAVVAPLVELLLAEKKDTFSILYVSPTRALVNDLYRRLADPMEYLGLTLARKTGDHPDFDEKKLPFAMITTPESFDSLLCRHPRVFRQLSAVILDELHLLDNTPRGDQLRVLLERLRMIKSRGPVVQWPGAPVESLDHSATRPQRSDPVTKCSSDQVSSLDHWTTRPLGHSCPLHFYALSATIEDEGIGERYFSNPVAVKVNETRAIEYVLFPETGDRRDVDATSSSRDAGRGGDAASTGRPSLSHVVDRVFAELRQRKADKVLFFFNARSFVEKYSRVLDRPPFAGKVWAHHASLTKPQREHVEHLMTTEKRGILCATSTLELGIDIGDIDAVVLFRPPFSVSSLLQRIGRGNRRTGGSLFAVGVYANDWEKVLFETFFDCARKGLLYEKRYNPCRSVLPQQTFSYLFQRRRIGTTQESLFRLLSILCPDRERLNQMFRFLLEKEYVKSGRPGIYYVSSALERETTRGKVHSNIQEKSFGDFEVVDCESGASIGRVFFIFTKFVLGGRAWEVVERRENEKRVLVRCLGQADATTKVFEGTGTVGYFYRFTRQLKARFFPGLGEHEAPFFIEDGQVYLYHFLGELYGSLICEAMGEQGIEVLDCGGKVFMWAEKDQKLATGDRWFPIPQANEVRNVIRRSRPMFEDRLGSGAFYRMLPPDLQVEDHFQALDVTGLLEFLRTQRVVEVQPDEAQRALADED